MWINGPTQVGDHRIGKKHRKHKLSIVTTVFQNWIVAANNQEDSAHILMINSWYDDDDQVHSSSWTAQRPFVSVWHSSQDDEVDTTGWQDSF